MSVLKMLIEGYSESFNNNFRSVNVVLSLGIVLKDLIFSQPISGKFISQMCGNVFVYDK